MKNIHKFKNFIKLKIAPTPIGEYLIKPSWKASTSFSNPYKIIIATHHKTGTFWLKTIFQSLALRYRLKMISVSKYTENEKKLLESQEWDILFVGHSNISVESIQEPYRGIHMIRDPRDMIVSGCLYHQKTDELWAQKQQEKYGGMSYREKLLSYKNMDDKILFEMEGSSYGNIRTMMAWDYQNKNILEIKYENLIKDEKLFLFHEIFSFLGVSGGQIGTALNIAWNGSLFSGKVKSSHIQSGQPQRWKKYFKKVHRQRFEELFGDCLAKLGYCSDWDLMD